MDVVARPPREPSLDLGMLMRAVVVRNQVNLESGRDIAVKVIKKREKLLGAMARLAHGNHFAIEHVECREQRGGAMAVIVVGHAFGITQAQRQHLGCAPALAPGSSRPRTAPAPCQAGSGTGPRYRAPSPQKTGRWRA